MDQNCFKSLIDEVIIERKRQDDRWKEQNHSDEWWLPILLEEIGEVSEAMLDDKFGQPPNLNQWEIRKELIEVVAVGIAWLECMNRREGERDEK